MMSFVCVEEFNVLSATVLVQDCCYYYMHWKKIITKKLHKYFYVAKYSLFCCMKIIYDLHVGCTPEKIKQSKCNFRLRQTAADESP